MDYAQNYADGFVLGTGAAINVQLGWIPSSARVLNLTDGDRIDDGVLGKSVMPFSGGGTTEVKAGAIIKGATSNATAVVLQVILSSGTWAAGNAAGFFILDLDSKVGTFGSENIYVISDTTAGIDDATVTVDVEYSLVTTTAVAAQASNGLSSYRGSATFGSEAKKGFTIGSTVSESGKLLFWQAWRNEQ